MRRENGNVNRLHKLIQKLWECRLSPKTPTVRPVYIIICLTFFSRPFAHFCYECLCRSSNAVKLPDPYRKTHQREAAMTAAILLFSLRILGIRRKQNFEIVFGFKSDTAVLTLLSAFSPPFFFRFSCLIFFSLAGHLVGFILVGRVFRKAFRILGLGERKGRWVVEQDFHGDFQVLVTWFFASFSGVLD